MKTGACQYSCTIKKLKITTRLSSTLIDTSFENENKVLGKPD